MPLVAMRSLSRTARAAMLVLMAMSTLALVVYMYIGLSCRFQADDFAYYDFARDHSVLRTVTYFYQTGGSGRFTFTFLAGSLSLIDPTVIRIVPALALVIWVAAVARCISRLTAAHRGDASRGAPFLLAEMLVLATITTAPNLWQSLYWMDSFFNYVLPLLLFMLYICLVLRACMHRPVGGGALGYHFMAATLTILAAGCNEVVGLLQCYLLTAAAAYLIHRRVGGIPLALVCMGAAASCLTLLVVALAPGTRARASQYTHPSIPAAFGDSIRDSLALAYDSLTQPPYTVLAVLIIAFAMGHLYRAACKPDRRTSHSMGFSWTWFWGIPPLTIGATIGCFVLPVYGLDAYPPHRVIIVPLYVLICGLGLWCYLLGSSMTTAAARLRRSSRLLMQWLVVCLLVLTMARALGTSLQYQAVARSWAALWDQRDASIRVAMRKHDTRLTLPAIPNMGAAGEPGSDPHSWNNLIVAAFYGIDSLTATGTSYDWEGTR